MYYYISTQDGVRNSTLFRKKSEIELQISLPWEWYNNVVKSFKANKLNNWHVNTIISKAAEN